MVQVATWSVLLQGLINWEKVCNAEAEAYTGVPRSSQTDNIVMLACSSTWHVQIDVVKDSNGEEGIQCTYTANSNSKVGYTVFMTPGTMYILCVYTLMSAHLQTCSTYLHY